MKHWSRCFLACTCMIAALTALSPLNAQNALWSSNPVDHSWNNPANWVPQIVPYGTAKFASSSITDVSITAASTQVNNIVFNQNADIFTITVPGTLNLDIYGEGVTNRSVATQNFNVSSVLTFHGKSAAGENTTYNNLGYNGTPSGIAFVDSSNAGGATLINHAMPGNTSTNWTAFREHSSAGSSYIINEGPNDNTNKSSQTTFRENSTAGTSSIVCKPDSELLFLNHASAGESTIQADSGSVIYFWDYSTADDSTISFSGNMYFDPHADGGTAHIIFLNGGNLIVNPSTQTVPITFGSVEGQGFINTDRPILIGSNNSDTTYSGYITSTATDRTLTKIGHGSLTLTNNNETLTGAKITGGGTLIVNNRHGSATGSGPVTVEEGTLGGAGSINGDVTIGSGSGNGAQLAPSADLQKLATLTIKQALSFKVDGTYLCKLDTKQSAADQVLANGVTIENGAKFILRGKGGQTLANGTSFIVLSNTAATAVSGTFTNLPDGGTISVDGNTFQANYEGGDGNDLTLTVIDQPAL